MVIGEEIASALSAQGGVEVTLQHRDVLRKAGPAPEGTRTRSTGRSAVAKRPRRSARAAMSARITGRFKIVNNLGLHARAATKLVQLASKFPCEVEIAHDDQAANGKSVMGVLLLCGSERHDARGARAQGERGRNGRVRAGHRCAPLRTASGEPS